MINSDIIKDLKTAISESGKKTSAYDTQAEVLRVEGQTAWVKIPGGVDETPVSMSVNASPGETVRVRVAGGQAWITGNDTAPPTDDTTAIRAEATAVVARDYAETALQDAEIAHEAALDAQASAAVASEAAGEAKASATNANEYASRALGGLSTVQSVAETLTWITQHGNMTQTTDTEPDPTHVYFVVDANGDYVVGSTHYSIVVEPKAEDLSSYYELTIDESLNNYVGTHLALTNDGLWLLPAASGTYKVLIATGATGSTYSAGTYIVDDTGATVAFYGPTVQIGKNGQSRIELDSLSFSMVDKDNNTYLKAEDLRTNGSYSVTDTFSGDGSTKSFTLAYTATNTSYTVSVSDSSGGTVTKTTTSITFASAPTDEATITVTYNTTSSGAKAFTFGTRSTGTIGGRSVAFGVDNVAKGSNSYTFGEGLIANKGQTVVGRYNTEESTKKLFIVGDGSRASDRETAMAVTNHGQISFGGQTAMELLGNDDAIMRCKTPFGEHWSDPGNMGFDMNGIVGTGWFEVSAAMITAGVDNMPPTTQPGKLFQYHAKGASFITQFYISREFYYDLIYIRKKNSGGWSRWQQVNTKVQKKDGNINGTASVNVAFWHMNANEGRIPIRIWGTVTTTPFFGMACISNVSNLTTTLTELTITNISGSPSSNIKLEAQATGTGRQDYVLRLTGRTTNWTQFSIELGNQNSFFDTSGTVY